LVFILSFGGGKEISGTGAAGLVETPRCISGASRERLQLVNAVRPSAAKVTIHLEGFGYSMNASERGRA
jgi:hypothetical protein